MRQGAYYTKIVLAHSWLSVKGRCDCVCLFYLMTFASSPSHLPMRISGLNSFAYPFFLASYLNYFFHFDWHQFIFMKAKHSHLLISVAHIDSFHNWQPSQAASKEVHGHFCPHTWQSVHFWPDSPVSPEQLKSHYVTYVHCTKYVHIRNYTVLVSSHPMRYSFLSSGAGMRALAETELPCKAQATGPCRVMRTIKSWQDSAPPSPSLCGVTS